LPAEEISVSLGLRQRESAFLKVALRFEQVLMCFRNLCREATDINIAINPITVRLSIVYKWALVPGETQVRERVSQLEAAGRKLIRGNVETECRLIFCPL